MPNVAVDPWGWFYYNVAPLVFALGCLWSIHKRQRWPAIASFAAFVIHGFAIRHVNPSLAYAVFGTAPALVLVALVWWGRDAGKVRWGRGGSGTTPP